MKIGFVSLMRFASWGGSEELWSKTALLALSEGHAVETLTYGGHPESPRIAQLRQAGADTKFYYPDSLAVQDRVAVKLGLKTRRSHQLPPMHAEVFIISNGSVWDFITFKWITEWIVGLGKPYLLLSHNVLDTGANLLDWHRDYAQHIFGRAAERLFVSERNRAGAERQMAAPVGSYHIASNPVNIRTAAIKPYPENDALLMASVGSLTCGNKGQDLLLEALTGEAWRQRAFRLRIYGAGPDEGYLRHLIAYYGLQEKVTLEGHVSDVDHIWEASQVLVLSSVSEGVPMVVAEAMLSGRAVLGTDTGAVDRYVVDGETGFLVEVAKAKYLAEGLERLWNSRDKLQRMGETAFHRTVAITDFQPEQTFLEIITAIE